MGTIAAVNPGVADLLQIVSNAGSPSLSSALSSSNLQSALQTASPADIAQLSSQALQLQVTNDLFASVDLSQTDGLFSALSPSTSNSGSNAALDNLLANLYSPTPAASPASPAAPASSLASQIATYQSNLQTEQLQALFGVDPTAGTPGSLVNVVA
jgi:hypothetical protein